MYIKREYAIEALGERPLNWTDSDSEIQAVSDYDMYISAIENLPSADVVERKRGKNISDKGFLCSVCSFGDFNSFHGYEPNYCPNCGASMESDEE